MLRNLMSYKVKGINGEDLRVKVHPLRKYFIRDSDREIICRLKNFFTYAYIPFVVTYAITNCRTYLRAF